MQPRAGRATWATEAPRGTLYHRYDVADDGTIEEAKIVPPTSQNLRHMEADLRAFLPGVLDLPDEELTRLCEMVVRNYDPCISCATHFLRLDVERVVEARRWPRVRVIGCGNPEAGDDAAGLARRRAARDALVPADVEVVRPAPPRSRSSTCWKTRTPW